MSDALIINLVSGKGGTGKTLFSAVLAEMLGSNGYETLVVDLDTFVRGLTSLLYVHKKGALNLTDQNQFTVSDIFMDKGRIFHKRSFDKFTNEQVLFSREGKGYAFEDKRIAISRYLSFDVVPSVSRVDKILDFRDLMPDTKDEALSILNELIAFIPEKYDFIILDSRAGYDELIAATHMVSDFSICIEEEDDISKITTENLIRQLENDSDSPLFRVVNKARSSQSFEELTKTSSITELGRIPFDMDIMKGFGGSQFWEETQKSLYKSALGHVWNNLCAKISINKKVNINRVSPFGSDKVESKLQMFSLRDRIVFFYGLLIGIVGLTTGFLDSEEIMRLLNNPTQLISIIMGFAGLAVSLLVVIKGKSR